MSGGDSRCDCFDCQFRGPRCHKPCPEPNHRIATSPKRAGTCVRKRGHPRVKRCTHPMMTSREEERWHYWVPEPDEGDGVDGEPDKPTMVYRVTVELDFGPEYEREVAEDRAHGLDPIPWDVTRENVCAVVREALGEESWDRITNRMGDPGRGMAHKIIPPPRVKVLEAGQ